MFFFILFISLLVIFGLLFKFKVLHSDFENGFDFVGMVVMVSSVLGLLFCLGILPVSRLEDRSYIEQYYVVKGTIEKARNNDTLDLERATAFELISDINAEIASTRYYNKSLWFDWFIVDEKAELPYLE